MYFFRKMFHAEREFVPVFPSFPGFPQVTGSVELFGTVSWHARREMTKTVRFPVLPSNAGFQRESAGFTGFCGPENQFHCAYIFMILLMLISLTRLRKRANWGEGVGVQLAFPPKRSLMGHPAGTLQAKARTLQTGLLPNFDRKSPF
jgi:hypothetical protein